MDREKRIKESEGIVLIVVLIPGKRYEPWPGQTA